MRWIQDVVGAAGCLPDWSLCPLCCTVSFFFRSGENMAFAPNFDKAMSKVLKEKAPNHE